MQKLVTIYLDTGAYLKGRWLPPSVADRRGTVEGHLADDLRRLAGRFGDRLRRRPRRQRPRLDGGRAGEVTEVVTKSLPRCGLIDCRIAPHSLYDASARSGP